MPLTTAGRDEITKALVGEAITAFNSGNARVGVGNSTTAFSAAHTDLQGASKLRKGMDATFPTRATNVLTFVSTFVEAEANFAWAEWGIFSASSGGTMLSRKVEALGTKPSSEAWKITATVTVVAS